MAGPATRGHRAPPPPPPVCPSSLFYPSSVAGGGAVSYNLPLPVQWESGGKPALGPEVPTHRIAPSRPVAEGERPYGSVPVDQQMRLSIAEGMEPRLQSAHKANQRLKERVNHLMRQNRNLRLALNRIMTSMGAGDMSGAFGAAPADDGEYADLIADFLQQHDGLGRHDAPASPAMARRAHVAQQKSALRGVYAPKDKPPGKPPPMPTKKPPSPTAATPHRKAPGMPSPRSQSAQHGAAPPVRPASASMVVVPGLAAGPCRPAASASASAGASGAQADAAPADAAARATLERQVVSLKRMVADLSDQLELARAAPAAAPPDGARHEAALIASLRSELEAFAQSAEAERQQAAAEARTAVEAANARAAALEAKLEAVRSQAPMAARAEGRTTDAMLSEALRTECDAAKREAAELKAELESVREQLRAENTPPKRRPPPKLPDGA